MNIISLNAKGTEKYEAKVQQFFDYFDKNIAYNKKNMDALKSYKTIGYESINGLLYKNMVIKTYNLVGLMNDMQKDKMETKNTTEITLDDICHEIGIQQTIQTCIREIKILDNIIAKAPKLNTADGITLYRGMNYDIQHDLICGAGNEKGVYYYTSPSYMSTSFKPSIAMKFADPQKSGVVLTIKCPPRQKVLGLFVNWKIDNKKVFENAEIDAEYEFILPRLTKFKLEKVEYVPYHEVYPTHTYRDLACRKQLLPALTIKNYVFTIVSQPTLTELTKTYKFIKKDVKFTIKTNDFDNLLLADYMPQSKKQSKSQ